MLSNQSTAERFLIFAWLICVVLYAAQQLNLTVPLGPVESPFPDTGGWLLIVEDTTDPDRNETIAPINTAKVRRECDRLGIDFRVRDHETKISEPWNAAREDLLSDRNVPAMIGRKGRRVYEGDLPKDEASMLATVEELGASQ